jgi:glycosyltransferase involved in cell wall biosynthesis
LREEGIGLVHANGLFALLDILPPARIKGLPVVGHMHSFDGLDHRAAGAALRRTDRVVTVCRAMENEIRERWGLPPERLETVPNGINAGAVRSAAGGEGDGEGFDGRVIGTATTFHPDKGFDILLEAMSLAGGDASRLKLAVLGDGPGRAEAQSRASALGLGDRVLWLGYRPAPYGLMRRFELFVLPSRIEASPVSILEAMALGVPVLATSVGGVPEMIEHGVSGWLAPPSDPETLAGALERLAGDGDLRQRLAGAADKRVNSEFSADRMAAGFRRIYRSLVEDLC